MSLGTALGPVGAAGLQYVTDSPRTPEGYYLRGPAA